MTMDAYIRTGHDSCGGVDGGSLWYEQMCALHRTCAPVCHRLSTSLDTVVHFDILLRSLHPSCHQCFPDSRTIAGPLHV